MTAPKPDLLEVEIVAPRPDLPEVEVAAPRPDLPEVEDVAPRPDLPEVTAEAVEDLEDKVAWRAAPRFPASVFPTAHSEPSWLPQLDDEPRPGPSREELRSTKLDPNPPLPLPGVGENDHGVEELEVAIPPLSAAHLGQTEADQPLDLPEVSFAAVALHAAESVPVVLGRCVVEPLHHPP